MNATPSSLPGFKPGSVAGWLAHGLILMVGLISACYFGISVLQSSPNGGDYYVAAPTTPAMNQPQLDAPEADVASEQVAVLPLTPEMARVRDYIARRYKVSRVALEPLLKASEETGRVQGIDPLLIVAMIGIESRFNPFAESAAGAQGLMQVIPRFHLDKMGPDADEDSLFDPLENIRVGTMVLKEGMRRTGGLQAALQYYGGAPDDPSTSYAKKVLSFKGQLEMVARRGA